MGYCGTEDELERGRGWVGDEFGELGNEVDGPMGEVLCELDRGRGGRAAKAEVRVVGLRIA